MATYNPNWIERFEEGSSQLHKILADYVVQIHHIGSTSILGCCAKPIIDMIPEVHSFGDQEIWIKLLQDAG